MTEDVEACKLNLGIYNDLTDNCIRTVRYVQGCAHLYGQGLSANPDQIFNHMLVGLNPGYAIPS